MDYDEPDGEKVILAVTRRNATDKENYMGPVLYNAGGPNTSGIDWFALWADILHDLVGRNHDIVTWDARSFSRSVPRISCWATQQRRSLWQASSPGLVTQYDDMAYLETHFHRHRVESSACIDMVGDTGILQHVSSTHNARDLHSLITALGQDKLRYVGQSYGCMLAVFFASMFPDQVERIVCDGNLDPREMRKGNFLLDTVDTSGFLLDFFAESCAANSSCALHEPTAEAVKTRLDAIIENSRFDLATPPIPTQFDYIVQPSSFTLAIGLLSGVTANPYTSFANVARALVAIEAGGIRTPESQLATTEWAGAAAFTDTKYRSPMDPDAGPKGFYNMYPQTEDWTICNDLVPLDDDLEGFKKALDEKKAQGPLQAASFSRSLGCMARKTRAKGTYTGELHFVLSSVIMFHGSYDSDSSDLQYQGPFGGNTSHPILFTNARFDPVTYVEMAHSNHEMFDGSGLLVYEAYGVSRRMPVDKLLTVLVLLMTDCSIVWPSEAHASPKLSTRTFNMARFLRQTSSARTSLKWSGESVLSLFQTSISLCGRYFRY
jgi:pimeloyl-ACP methyl ester carboxylesterase